MPNRSKDWLAQAERDLNHAISACDIQYFEWSCFSSQQAAEKAVKAVFLRLHGEGWGHSVLGLLKALGEQTEIPPDLLDTAKALDKHYIPTRYPNGFDAGMPGDYYTKKDADEAIENARKIVEFCADCVRR